MTPPVPTMYSLKLEYSCLMYATLVLIYVGDDLLSQVGMQQNSRGCHGC